METTSQFFCSSEWHLARMRREYAAVVYSFALHLSKKSGIFSASIPDVAEYFGADERAIGKAVRELLATGFFEVVVREVGASVCYHVVTHKEWSHKHPGHCVEKLMMPWSGETADTLAVELHAISGGRFTSFPNFVKGMRNTGHSDASIRDNFRDFIQYEKPVGRQWMHGFHSKFIKHLKSQPVTSNDRLRVM